MHDSENSDATKREFGVRVARIHAVSDAGVKTARSSRTGSSGACYNRRRINELETKAAGAKTARFLDRHGLGDNVKGIVPARLWGQIGRRRHKRARGYGI